MFVGQLIHVTLVVQIVAASNDGADGFAVCPLAVGYLLSLLMTSHARHVELTNNSGSSTSGPTHSSALAQCEDGLERMRMLSTAPLFSLWTDVRRELDWGAAEIERLREENARIRARIAALEGEDA